MLRNDDGDRTRVAYINLNKFGNDSPQKTGNTYRNSLQAKSCDNLKRRQVKYF